MCAAPSGSFEEISPPMPIPAATSLTSKVRSSVTSPSVVERNLPSSSSRSEEALVRDTVGVLPEALDLLLLKRFLRGARRDLAQAARDRPGEQRGLRRQRARDLTLDIDVLVDRVDDEVGERVLDRRVLEQLGACFGPGARLERLALRPERQHGHEPHDRGEDQENDRARSAAS